MGPLYGRFNTLKLSEGFSVFGCFNRIKGYTYMESVRFVQKYILPSLKKLQKQKMGQLIKHGNMEKGFGR